MRMFISIRKASLPLALSTVVLVVGFVNLWIQGNAVATPLEFSDVDRKQKVNQTVDDDDLLRIWMVYVGQGDGILIQLPKKYSYSVGGGGATERVDIVVDAGSFNRGNRDRMGEFLTKIYGGNARIEHAVISHHDQDHVLGVTELLKNEKVTLERMYHNGLASYINNVHDFRDDLSESEAVFKEGTNGLTRGMAFIKGDMATGTLREKDIITGKGKLETELANFQGIYKDLAEAFLLEARPKKPVSFTRTFVGDEFPRATKSPLKEAIEAEEIGFRVLWPENNLRPYGNSRSSDWGETINGNSVTFRLDYGDFSMLFTGDHNKQSLPGFVESLPDDSQSWDVLKVPHHGSKHVDKSLFQDADSETRAVFGVASMGPRGFNISWEHPNTKVIDWMGGFNRVFSTYAEEGVFSWKALEEIEEADEAEYERRLAELVEIRHVLIETDGKWFRIVEVPLTHPNLNRPPTVQETGRGDGTRWVKAR